MPSTSQYHAGLTSSGATARIARIVAIAAAGKADIRVAVPAAATTTTAPAPAQNQPAPAISGYSETDARITAAAEVSVSRWFIPRLLACLVRLAGRPAGVAVPVP